MPKTTLHWANRAAHDLQGRRIVKVRYMTAAEADDAALSHRALLIELDDGNQIWAMSDDEGNDAGALGTTYDTLPVIPRLPA